MLGPSQVNRNLFLLFWLPFHQGFSMTTHFLSPNSSSPEKGKLISSNERTGED